MADPQKIRFATEAGVEKELVKRLESPKKGASRQSVLLGMAMRGLRKGLATKIVIRGDSTTYGHDTVSADKVAAPTTTLPDGSKHSFTRSPKPYPEAMQDNLNLVYNGVVTVENQGYSGDWVKRGFDRWTTNVGAALTIISYGINDGSASYVPEEFRGNVEAFVDWTERMIIRDLEWGSAVVLLTSTRQLGSAGNMDTDTFRNALEAMATKYGIPLIDGEQFLANQTRDAWSDGNHLTTKGNAVMGARLAAVFVGEGPQAPLKVTSGSKLLARPTLDNIIFAGAVVSNSDGYATPRDNSATSGLGIALGNGIVSGYAYWGFYTDAPDTIVFPLTYLNFTGSATYELDFGVPQGDDYHSAIATPGYSTGVRPPIAASSVVQAAPGTGSTFQSDPRAAGGAYIRVATAGWHVFSVRLQRANTTDGVSLAALHALEFISNRDFTTMRDLAAYKIANAITMKSGTFHQLVPPSYNESTDIVSTKVNWVTIIQALGISDWVSSFYGAPAIKLTLRSYGAGIIEYVFLLTVPPNGFVTADVAPAVVGAASIAEGTNTLTTARQLRSISLTPAGMAPEANVSMRELESIAYDGATGSLVLAWRTTNSSGGTAKNMKKNFVMDFTIL